MHAYSITIDLIVHNFNSVLNINKQIEFSLKYCKITYRFVTTITQYILFRYLVNVSTSISTDGLIKIIKNM